jgi:signal transduction histidine kinase
MKSARYAAEDSAAEARELEGQLLEISDAEQRRIGHDLHDGLGQQLTGIALMTRRLEETLAADKVPAAQEASKICELAKGAIEWTRDLCRSLSPPSLDRAGLAHALSDLLANAEVIFHIHCELEQHGDTSTVKPPASVHLYRIAQEAISNAAHHGRAKQIMLQLDVSADSLVMQISDDGTGMQQSSPSTNGMGLRIMQYRARMIGASIEVCRAERCGTTVTCRYRFSKANHGNQHNQNQVAGLSR